MVYTTSAIHNTPAIHILRVGIAVFGVGILESVTNPLSYLGVLVGAAIVLEVLRLLYRLNTWSPQGT